MTETETRTAFQRVAEEFAGAFETARRDENDPESTYTRRRADSADWTRDLVYSAHGDFGPDDWRYDAIRAAADAIAECGDEREAEDRRGEWADGHVDVYTGARLQWLASNLNRVGYCDEAASEFGGELDITDRIGQGQYMEAEEVYGLVLAGIVERAEEIEADELDAEDEDA